MALTEGHPEGHGDLARAHRPHGASGPHSGRRRSGDGLPGSTDLGRVRRAIATSLELLAELLVDGHPADRAERALRRRAGRPLAMAVPWHELRYGHTQTLRSWLSIMSSPPAQRSVPT